jgi:hypothetical protein
MVFILLRLYACEFQALFEVDTALRWEESFTEPAIRARAEINKSRRCVRNGTSGLFTESAQDKADSCPAGQSPRLDAPTTAPGICRGKYEVDRDDGEGGEIPEDNDMYVLPLKLSSCRVLIPQVQKKCSISSSFAGCFYEVDCANCPLVRSVLW